MAEERQKEEEARKLADEKASQLAELKQKEEGEPQVRIGTMNVVAMDGQNCLNRLHQRSWKAIQFV